MMTNDYFDGVKEKFSGYSDGLKDVGKKTLAGLVIAGIVGTSGVSGYAADGHLYSKHEKVESYSEQNIMEEQRDMFKDLYNFLVMGEEKRGYYPIERYEMALENLAEKHTSDCVTEAGEDMEKFAAEANYLVPKFGDLFFGDADGVVEDYEYQGLFENLADNKAFQTLRDNVLETVPEDNNESN